MSAAKQTPCHCCNGSGEESDDASTGRRLRKLRQVAGIEQKAMACTLGISPSMLVHLEHGRRRWKAEWILRYERACEL